MLSKKKKIPAGLIGLMWLLCPPAMAADEMLQQYDCMIQPNAVMEIGTREIGTLEEIRVKRGDLVKKDQAIAVLESGVEKIAVEFNETRARMNTEIEAKEARLKFLQNQLLRMEDLFARKSVSFQEKDKAEIEVTLAEIELRQARENKALSEIELKRSRQTLDTRTIRSPVDGVVMGRLLELGESVENRPMVKIAAVNPLHVELILNEDTYGLIKVGDSAQVTPLMTNGTARTVKVSSVDGIIDAASGTYGIRLEIPNPDYSIPGGLRCHIEFENPAE